MFLKSVLGIAACGVLILASVGCRSSHSIHNAQGSHNGYHSQGGQPVHFGNDGASACESCGGNCNGTCGKTKKGWFPHRRTVDYQTPKGLRYPQANQPMSGVQYPYYTLKGPDTFFFKE